MTEDTEIIAHEIVGNIACPKCGMAMVIKDFGSNVIYCGNGKCELFPHEFIPEIRTVKLRPVNRQET